MQELVTQKGTSVIRQSIKHHSDSVSLPGTCEILDIANDEIHYLSVLTWALLHGNHLNNRTVF